jgi:hypothetical protein
MNTLGTGDLSIRALRPDEIRLAVDWAAKEGWNPGLKDADAFGITDPEGFLVAEQGGQPAAVISVVNYDERFAFLGFYIVREDLRGRGIGWKIWQAGRVHAGDRTIGLDGVVAQQANYAKDGFALSHRNIRFGGLAPAGVKGRSVPLAEVPFTLVEASDALVFPAARSAFLRAWLGTQGHHGRALLQDGRLAAWGVIRPARSGFKIGPLVAEDWAAAEEVFLALAEIAAENQLFLDVPEPNGPALRLAQRHGLAPVFETARMYTGPIRPLALDRLYGVTSFELG